VLDKPAVELANKAISLSEVEPDPVTLNLGTM